ncbi:PqqD family peptide modification chaperone [Dethiosulfatarculus sandiegensis]|uniref:PqqD family protein n=1 Tax=Dethiosulfatarculus sandiegensis TaxID=1429043 RepID=A0A0D2J8V2_9BACT|nr:PqqD family peptide modification chaperone [Dethiosulfatarculus sandiegensis]KIX14599.1 hypothetical protein X474_07475 [Dethiosulfatarculus sandiegensis]
MINDSKLYQNKCDIGEDTGDGYVIYRRNDKAEEEVHILNETAFEIFEMCNGKIRNEIMEYFRLNYELDKENLALVNGAIDDMLEKGIITAEKQTRNSTPL